MTGTTGSMMRPIFILLLVPGAAGPGEEENELTCDNIRDATVGEDVTLRCHRKNNIDVTDKSIIWTFNGTSDVLVYKSKGISHDDQEEEFRGRASKGSSWKTTEGEVPVKISSVKETDAGKYTCTVGKKSENVSCSTRLNILQLHKLVNSPPPDQLDGNRTSGSDKPGSLPTAGTIIGIVIAVIAVIVIIVVIAIWRARHQKGGNNAAAACEEGEEMTELRGNEEPDAAAGSCM